MEPTRDKFIKRNIEKNPTYFNDPSQSINFEYVKGVSLAEAVYKPHLRLPKHLHHNAGFCLTLQGQYTETDGKRLLECHPLGVKFNPAGDEHSNSYGKESVHVFVIELKNPWLIQTGADKLVERSSSVFRHKSISWMMMRLRQEFHSRDLESTLAIEGITLEIIAEASRQQTKFAENNYPDWLRQAKEFMDDCFSEPLSLFIIAQTVGVHPVYLAQTFKKYYRCNIGDYLRKRRVEFAGHQLSNSTDELAEIALAAGFSNQAHFTRIFKQITGLTPAQYRLLSQPS